MHATPFDRPTADQADPRLSARPLPELDEAWKLLGGGARLEAVERAAPRLRDAIRASGTVLLVRTLDIARFPYPTRYAFGGHAELSVPYVWMCNRALLLEYKDLAGTKRRLLANPTRPDGAKKAPYFKRIYAMVPKAVEPWFERSVGKRQPPLPEQLEKIGVPASSIDYITFDHLHTQEVGPMLGPSGQYPNASLLVTKDELAAVRALHPLQRFWYVEGGIEGIAEEHLRAFDRDLLLGEGLALVRTPGHTDGNHTIVFNLPDGLMTVSENGVAAECYAPEKSDIPGLRDHAKRSGEKVILNANSRERTLDQYTSMRLEAILADPTATSAEDKSHGFPRHFSSSELVKSLLAPGATPAFVFESVSHGQIG